ncbi:sulfite exporter TauE/SafE family protein [Aestuariibacter halophilus]|uniref:Probable membrane transporter protein n=1 Tax=Fluctibacter halophilus TaxID=226011 RepID=A0ABS8G6R7_9ALTE|nr:sulfite exporter TauE/SafE family protein [Aestuariibacter halophilus]MCC2616282.1 sulfite exporter TauE/SafE family protein [Aestuariibacter halophilus]
MTLSFSPATLTRVTVAVFWCALLVLLPDSLGLIRDYAAFLLLGVTGAVFANATGAGGGVVFIPFFNQLDFSPQVAVATSFAIQCCGMTAGALTWWAHYRHQHRADQEWQPIGTLVWITVLPSIAGLWLAQGYQHFSGPIIDADVLHWRFGVFSIFLAIAIVATVPLMKQRAINHRLARFDYLSLVLIALMGGAVTSWLSIGVGELVAIYLILRRFNVTLAIAVAVILSAFTVWAGVMYHALVSATVFWPVVLFAGAGAIIGGQLAKYLVLWFSPTHLKLFFAGWVLVLGVAALPA